MAEIIFHTLAALGFGALVGVALGLTGGGGSIFAVPLLIYGLGLAPVEAVPISLVVVATTALAGAVHSLREGLIVWTPTVLFALGGIVGAPAGIGVAGLVSPQWIVAGFGALALAVGALMWHGARVQPSAVRARSYARDEGAVCALSPDGRLRLTTPCALALVVAGLGTGMLSGLFGVGGGFLIVPALVLVTRMGVHRAVAVSLVIISIIGFAGAASVIWQRGLEWRVLVPFAAGGVLAILATRRIARRVAGPVLQRVFAASVTLVGAAMLVESIL